MAETSLDHLSAVDLARYHRAFQRLVEPYGDGHVAPEVEEVFYEEPGEDGSLGADMEPSGVPALSLKKRQG